MHIPTLAFVPRLASAQSWTQPGRPPRVSPLMPSSLEAADPKVTIVWVLCPLSKGSGSISGSTSLVYLKPQPGLPTVAVSRAAVENAKLWGGMGFENGLAEILGERDQESRSPEGVE